MHGNLVENVLWWEGGKMDLRQITFVLRQAHFAFHLRGFEGSKQLRVGAFPATLVCHTSVLKISHNYSMEVNAIR